MDEGEVAEGVGAEGVTYSDDGEGHFGAKLVDHVEEVTGMVTPCSWSCVRFWIMVGNVALTIVT